MMAKFQCKLNGLTEQQGSDLRLQFTDLHVVVWMKCQEKLITCA